jgi:uncharacterized membrane protein YdbT with pleckstrin-like domain
MGKKIDKSQLIKETIEWSDRKRTLFGLPWSFTKYRLTKTRLVSEIGLFSTNTNEILLYRVLDVELNRTLGQKIFKTGDVILFSADPSSPNFTIKNIKQPKELKSLLSALVEAEREDKSVVGREMYGAADDVAGGAGHAGHHHEGV